MTSALGRLSRPGRVLKPRDLLPYLAPLQQRKCQAQLPPGTAVKIGIAVSGGPDSMALAYLLKNLDPQLLGFPLSPTALIVDHSMRSGSDLEARKVSGWCHDLDIPALIGTIDWSNEDQSRPISEGFARVARHNEFDRLLEGSSIPLLFLGHHQDDNVETVMMRMMKRNVPILGLLGMRGCTQFPVGAGFDPKVRRGTRNAEPPLLLDEAFGTGSSLLLGASEDPKTADEDPYADVGLPFAANDHSPILDSLNGAIKIFGVGGVMIHRPLLAFTKQDLIDTCKAYAIPYVLDPTNDDATYTVRNAVRTLRKDYSLPLALRHSRLLTTMSRASTAQEVFEARVSSFLRFIRILNFDLRSGIASIQIPEVFATLCRVDRKAANAVVVQLTQLVLPNLGIGQTGRQLSENVKAADYLYPLTQTSARHESQAPRTFTWRGVRFDLIEVGALNRSLPSRIWGLSRMLPNTRMPLTVTGDFTVCPDAGLDGQYESRTVLWDNRYWVKLSSNSQTLIQQVRIRRYAAVDAAEVYKQMGRSETAYLAKQLHESAPGAIRYTLPVLTINDKVIAFPTLSTVPLPMSQFLQAIADLGLKDTVLNWSVIFRPIEVILPLSEWGSELPPSQEDFESSWQHMASTDTEAASASEVDNPATT